MTVTADYHTHSKYSKNNHGKDTLAEMVRAAENASLVSYGISDHGPSHFLFGIKRKNIKRAKAELEKLKKDTKLNLYFSIEANLISKDGKIDLNEQEIAELDYLLVGYHRGTITNFVNPLLPKNKQIENHTKAYINCLDRYNVFALTHLNTYIKVDLKKVAKKAAERGTLIELNNKHINFSERDAKDLIESGCKFLVSSDAHKKEDVARVDRALEFIKNHKIPLERVVNIDKIYR